MKKDQGKTEVVDRDKLARKKEQRKELYIGVCE